MLSLNSEPVGGVSKSSKRDNGRSSMENNVLLGFLVNIKNTVYMKAMLSVKVTPIPLNTRQSNCINTRIKTVNCG